MLTDDQVRRLLEASRGYADPGPLAEIRAYIELRLKKFPTPPALRAPRAAGGFRVVVRYRGPGPQFGMLPARGLARETAAWAGMRGDVEFRQIPAGEDGLFQFLATEWAEGEGFMVVDQDLVPPPGAVEELEACTQHWCGFPFRYPMCTEAHVPDLAVGDFGCTRFSTELVRVMPDLLEETTEEHNPWWLGGGPRSRLMVAERFIYRMNRYGLHFHAHWPEAEHLQYTTDRVWPERTMGSGSRS